MKNIKAVVGSNWGDEGKGLMTDYFCSEFGSDGIVVRFNSGAQAGHTVCLRDKRHIFGHIGSGTYRGTPTYLSKFFVCNPILYIREYSSFEEIPEVYVDPDCLVTTPYDMLINQVAETMRGSKRHGSCGVGFNETIVRNLIPEFALRYKDLSDSISLRTKLVSIRQDYLPLRFRDLNIDISENQEALKLIMSGTLLEKFIDDCLAFTICTVKEDIGYLKHYNNIIFEGAQGLMLDQNNMEYYPHLTRSNTGIQNVVELMSEAGETYVEAVYVTRSYLTRHGAGILPNELGNTPYPSVIDKTNQPNTWQGNLRFAYLDVDRNREVIDGDMRHAMFSNVKVNRSMAVTCLDQISAEDLPDSCKFYYKGEFRSESTTDLLYVIAKVNNTFKMYESWGPQATDVNLV